MSGNPDEGGLSPEDRAAIFSALLPGDDLFPPAGDLNIGDTVEGRLEATAPAAYARFLGALTTEKPPALLSTSRLVSKLKDLEADAPEDFAKVLSVIYLCYYETDPVHAAINAMGKRYNTHPQPDGYPLPVFAPSDAPSGKLGWYLPTDQVRRIPIPPGLETNAPGAEET